MRPGHVSSPLSRRRTSGAGGAGRCDGAAVPAAARRRRRPALGAALAPGLDLGVDVPGGGDDRRPAGELAAGVDDPGVEVRPPPGVRRRGSPPGRARASSSASSLRSPIAGGAMPVIFSRSMSRFTHQSGSCLSGSSQRLPGAGQVVELAALHRLAAPAGRPSGSGCGSAPARRSGRCARRARPRSRSGRCAEVRTRTRRADGTWSPPRWSVAPVTRAPRTTRPLGQGPITTPAVVAEVVPPGPVAVTVQVIVAPTSPAASVSLFVVWPATVVPLRCQA